MRDLTSEHPRQVSGLTFTPVEGGCNVEPADGKRVHYLNPSAAAILLLCDGRRSITEIAEMLQAEHALAARPDDDVRRIIAEFAELGLVRSGPDT